MRYVPRQSVLASTLAVALATGSAPGRTAPQPGVDRPAPAPACSLSVFPEEVSAGRPDTRVLAETSERLTGSPRAEMPAGSGIEIRDVEPDVSPDSWVLRLDLSGARPGQWEITLEGRSTECVGDLEIQDSSAGRDLPDPLSPSTRPGS